MKCSICMTELKPGITTCPNCGSKYPGNVINGTASGEYKSRSKAAYYMATTFVRGYKYLGYPSDFCRKRIMHLIIYFVPTLMLNFFIQIIQNQIFALKILTKRVNEDYNGIPLV